MPVCGIYRVTHRASERHYIGQGVNVLARFRDHINGHGSRKLRHALKKYGHEAFDFAVVLECPRSQLNAREVEQIAKFNSLHPRGFNLIGGGEQRTVFTPEVRRNFRAAGRRRYAKPEGKQQLDSARASRWAKPGEREKQAETMKRALKTRAARRGF